MFRFKLRTTADVVSGLNRMVSELEAVANERAELAAQAEREAEQLRKHAAAKDQNAKEHYDERAQATNVMLKVRALIS